MRILPIPPIPFEGEPTDLPHHRRSRDCRRPVAHGRKNGAGGKLAAPETTAPDSVELVGLDPAAPEPVTAALKGIDNVIAAAKATGAAHIALLPSIAAATDSPASTPSARRDRPPARPTHPRTHPD
ncbi:hypothetical protein ACW9HR_04160 [Nocardia gipuzkoensis]